MKKKAVVIVGPTASGKTSLGVYVANKFNGEVISADSMQIYKGMYISTAKPTKDEMQGIKHHMIDFVEINDKYSVSNYCEDARKCFDDITARGKLPVIVGGTGLYVDSFLTNTTFFDDASSADVKAQLNSELSEKGVDYMYSRLASVDPEAAEKIHPNNTVRVARALEIYKTTGKTLTEQNRLSHSVESDIEPLYIGINYSDRDNLYKRITNTSLLIRKIYITAEDTTYDSDEEEKKFEQMDLFTDYAALESKREEEKMALEKEKKLQQAILKIQQKHGKNALLKGMNLEEGAMTRERNQSIGGHKA